MPASQHQSPKSDIEISQTAKKRPILDIAREKLGITPENLEPYGHYKAKVSMDYVKSLQDRPNGKLILVSAITPTPAAPPFMPKEGPSEGSRRQSIAFLPMKLSASVRPTVVVVLPSPAGVGVMAETRISLPLGRSWSDLT